MMEVGDIVSYETAKKLKASGFLQEWDSGGHKYLYLANDRICRISNVGCYNFVDEPKDKLDIPNKNYPCVPLWQAQKWLRENKHISIRVNYLFEEKRWFPNWLNLDSGEFDDIDEFYVTYEEALSAGINAVLNMINNKTD